VTATNLTASIAGTIYPVLNTTYKLDDRVDERSAVRLTILDANNIYNFTPFQPVTITDTLEGVRYTGFTAKPIAVKYAANVALAWTIDCIDNEFLAGKKTTNRVINQQYAGIAAASMVNDHLSQDGVVANYAVRDDNSQLDFAQGTLNGTQATGNLGGDLELALAGRQVTVLENTTSAFSTGSLNNCTATGNTLTPTATPTIKIQATQSVAGVSKCYTYVKIWSGSVAIVASRYLTYSIYIDSSSPEAKIGVDLVFTDGTALRDIATSNNGAYFDAQNKSPHPGTDLAGLANGQWYSRSFLLDEVVGKTIAYATVVVEGDEQGAYTGYIKNILEVDGGGVVKNTFFGSSLNVNPPQQMQKSGYSGVSVSVVNTYDSLASYRVSAPYSISNANILRDSFITWNATTPENTDFGLKYSLNGGNSYIQCANNSPLPSLPAGTSLSGLSIQFAEEFTQNLNASPETPPVLNSLKLVLNPSYTASKSDVLYDASTDSVLNAGTLTNTIASTGFGFLNLIGAVKNWDDGNLGSQNLFGGGATGPNNANSCFQYVDSKQFRMEVHQSTEARSRMDFAGQWSNFTMEFDVYVDNSLMIVGCFYRTTGTSNYDAQYAYAVQIIGTTISLQRGSNSNAASAGTRTQVATATVNLTSQATHHIKVIANGSNHQVYFDDVLAINATDSTYTGSGYVGFRVSNGDPSNGYISLFDNFGINSVGLSGTWVSPNIDISGASHYGNSALTWADASSVPGLASILVEASLNNGGSYATCTNGGPIPGFSVGDSLGHVKFRVTLATPAASVMAGLRYFVARVVGQFSSTGTRIAPFLSLSNALIAGSTLSSWVATTPANTSVAVSTSLDGTSYSSATNGGGITGITSQPSPTLDTFSSNSSPNYTQSNRTGGSAGTWFWDTLNSLLSVSGGTNALLLLSSIPTCKDVDIYLDFDQSDQAGLVWRWADASNFYELDVFDASSSTGTTNKVRLYKVVANVKTQLGGDVAVTLTRGYKYRLHVTMVGAAINVWIDGVNLISTTDSSLSAAGKVGIISATGIGRFYNFRVQPQGDNLSGKVVYSKVTLTSTDPTQTPQLTDLTVAALHPNIGIGALIPTADYTNTYISDNLNDLAKKSDYTQFIDQNLNFIFGPRVAQPAPWILQSADPKLLLAGPLTVDYSADLYRNEMILNGVVATGIKSEIKIGDGNTTSWALGGELIATPIILLNNQAQTVGIKGIDTGKNFYWTPGSNAIDQDPSGTVLQQTDTLLFQNYTYQYITSITVDNTNLANTVTQKQLAQRMGRSFAVQNIYSSASAAHTSSSDIGDVDVSKCRRIAVDINITAVSGSTPTIQFFVDRKDVNGIYSNLWSSSVVSAVSQVSTTIGAFGTIAQALGAIARLRWAIGGSTPSFAFSISIMGTLDTQSAGLGIVAVVEDVSSQSLNVAAATAYGNSLLQRYGTQGRTITFKTWRRNPSLAISQYLPVFIPEHNINDASMLITGISTTQKIGYEGGTPTQNYFQMVTCTEQANVGSPWKLLASTLK
jgi:hypothetical protein